MNQSIRFLVRNIRYRYLESILADYEKITVSPENNITIPTFVSFFEPASDITGQECRFLGDSCELCKVWILVCKKEKKKKKGRSWAFMSFSSSKEVFFFFFYFFNNLELSMKSSLLWYRFLSVTRYVGYRNTLRLSCLSRWSWRKLIVLFLPVSLHCVIIRCFSMKSLRVVWYRFSSVFRNRGKWRWFAWEFRAVY